MAVKHAQEKELYDRLSATLEKYKGKPGVLIAALQVAQDIF